MTTPGLMGFASGSTNTLFRWVILTPRFPAGLLLRGSIQLIVLCAQYRGDTRTSSMVMIVSHNPFQTTQPV